MKKILIVNAIITDISYGLLSSALKSLPKSYNVKIINVWSWKYP